MNSLFLRPFFHAPASLSAVQSASTRMLASPYYLASPVTRIVGSLLLLRLCSTCSTAGYFVQVTA